MTTALKRLCSLCKKELFYSCTSALNLATRRNSKCDSCSKRGRPSSNKGVPFKGLYNHVVYISKNRNIGNSLTFGEFLEFTKIDKCHYCGNQVTWNAHRHSGKVYHGYNLDRKDNDDGYTKNNCVVCCDVCNYMKRTMPIEKFIQHCKDIVTHQQKVISVT